MAGTTPIYAFPYPSLSDPPNGAAQVQALATALENKIVTMDSALTAINSASSPYSKGRVGGVAGNTDTPFTTTETVFISAQFTAVSGRRYKFTADFVYYQSAGTAGTNMYQRVRVISGGTPTATGGTLVRTKLTNTPPSTLFLGVPATLTGTWVAPSSGTFTASVTFKTSAGTCNVSGGTDSSYELVIEDDGV